MVSCQSQRRFRVAAGSAIKKSTWLPVAASKILKFDFNIGDNRRICRIYQVTGVGRIIISESNFKIGGDMLLDCPPWPILFLYRHHRNLYWIP